MFVCFTFTKLNNISLICTKPFRTVRPIKDVMCSRYVFCLYIFSVLNNVLMALNPENPIEHDYNRRFLQDCLCLFLLHFILLYHFFKANYNIMKLSFGNCIYLKF